MNLKHLFLALILTASPVLAADPSGLLQEHEMVDIDGEDVSLADFAGEVVVVNFWASWCEPCLHELPKLDVWNKEWAGKGARVVAISIDKDERNARQFVAKNNLGMTVWIDGPKGLARALNLPAVPTTYVIDRDGKVVLRISGSSDKELVTVREKVEWLLANTKKGPQA